MKPGFKKIPRHQDTELIEEEQLYKRPILDMILGAILQSSFLESERHRPRLHNEDIVKLIKASLPSRIVIRMIELYESEFDTSDRALLILQRCGIGKTIVEAILSRASSAIASSRANPDQASLA